MHLSSLSNIELEATCFVFDATDVFAMSNGHVRVFYKVLVKEGGRLFKE